MENEILGSFIFNLLMEGSKACFTKPECKTDRDSYPIPTPSALVGVLEAVYWHPPVEYKIKKIAVCNQPRFQNIRKNEIKVKGSADKIKQEMNGTGDAKIYAAENQTQRNTRFLVDVKYVVQVEAIIRNTQCERDIELGINVFEKQKAEILNRFKKQIYRRQPFLGMSEYNDTEITWVPDFEKAAEENISDEVKCGTTDYGWMLYLIQYPNKTKKGINYKSGDVYPLFYHPILKHGIVNVDEYPVSRRIA